MNCEATKNLKMRAFFSAGAGFIGRHLLSRLFFRKNGESVKFTSWEQARDKALALVRFDCSTIKALCWRISGAPMKAILEDISYA